MAHGESQRIGGELGLGTDPLLRATNVNVTSLDGVDETATPGTTDVYAVTGMTEDSVVLSIVFASTKAAVATLEILDPASYVPGDATLTADTAVDRSNDQLIVTWAD